MNQKIIDQFLECGKHNLAKDIEFCAILCGREYNGEYYCTHLLVPRQTGTRDSCTALNEIALFEYQMKHELITMGWIHVCYNYH
jgi:STAM-binding protein